MHTRTLNAMVSSPVRACSLTRGVVKSPVKLVSLCTGEVMPSRFDSSLASCTSQRVVINTSRVNLNTSLELTTRTPDRSHSVASTHDSDSFVLMIDWQGDAFNRVGDSIEDPPLEKRMIRNQRRRNATESRHEQHEQDADDLTEYRHSQKSNSTPETTPLHFSPSESYTSPSSPVQCSPKSRSTTQRVTPTSAAKSKSLGSFQFPTKSNAKKSPQSKTFVGNFDFSSIEVPNAPFFGETDELSLPSEARSHSELQLESSDSSGIKFWESAVQTHKENEQSLPLARAMLELGQAQACARDFASAEMSLAQAHRIFRRLKLPLAMARVLDHMGVLCIQQEKMNSAIGFLRDAFGLRYDKLGAWHVDTVESLNHLAKAYLLKHNFIQAVECYWQVFWLRKAIFGPSHPSVAVTAHDLANAFVGQGRFDDADNFYEISMEIYDKMSLPIENPAVARLLRDMRRLERLDRQAR